MNPEHLLPNVEGTTGSSHRETFSLKMPQTERVLTQSTVQFKIHYISRGTPLLVGFTDSDWAGDPDDQKSTTGYVFSLGSKHVTYSCKKQRVIYLSSTEAKYRAMVSASQEAL